MSNTDDSRDRIERLIAAADRVAQQPLPEPPPRSRWLPVAALAVAGIGAVALGVNLASGREGGGTTVQTSTVPTAVPSIVVPTSLPVVITFPPTSAPLVTVPPSTSPPATTTTASPATTTTWVQQGMQPVRWSSYEAGTFVLQGAVPDSATADSLTAKFAAGAGADHVVARYVIAAAAPLPEAEPMYAFEALQFAPNSTALQPAAVAFLDQLGAVLVANPTATLEIFGHTDGVGPADSNLALSQARVDAIAAHLIGAGVAPERLTAIGQGEAFPLAPDDTEEGRAKNRRIELMLHHLLG